jgi:PD-(D/E)XK nuclease superfamily
MPEEMSMVYSYTQISQYLRCPRSYRYRYLDGWKEKETPAAMAFGRVLIHDPGKNLQIKILRSLPGGAEFVAYMDAIGEIDGTRCLIDWKTTTSRYPDEPSGLLSLDPQLLCYSWISGISDVAFVVFVR